MKKVKYFLIYGMTYGALSLLPLLSYAEDDDGLGGMAQRLAGGPLEGLYSFMRGVCLLVGIVLLMVAVNKYQRHRMNEQEVPISTPIVYAILGAVMILLSFVHKLIEMSSS